MKKTILIAAAVVLIPAAITLTTIRAQQSKKEIVRITPERVRWFTPAYYKDGRQRAQLFGDSSQGGVKPH